jgi:hypothetical protein
MRRRVLAKQLKIYHPIGVGRKDELTCVGALSHMVSNTHSHHSR